MWPAAAPSGQCEPRDRAGPGLEIPSDGVPAFCAALLGTGSPERRLGGRPPFSAGLLR